jgi:uncharacterized lipoprotein YmbA
LGILLTALLFAGCLGRSPTTEYYSLRALSADAGDAAPAPADGVALGLGPAELPRYLDRPQIARRSGESGIVYDDFRRWAGRLDAELLRVLAANLSVLLPTDRVAVYPGDAPFPLEYRVLLDVERFEAGPDDVVTLRARWVILSAGDGETLAVGRTDVGQPARSESVQDLVAAHSAAADTLSRAIAARLRELAVEAP